MSKKKSGCQFREFVIAMMSFCSGRTKTEEDPREVMLRGFLSKRQDLGLLVGERLLLPHDFAAWISGYARVESRGEELHLVVVDGTVSGLSEFLGCLPQVDGGERYCREVATLLHRARTELEPELRQYLCGAVAPRKSIPPARTSKVSERTGLFDPSPNDGDGEFLDDERDAESAAGMEA